MTYARHMKLHIPILALCAQLGNMTPTASCVAKDLHIAFRTCASILGILWQCKENQSKGLACLFHYNPNCLSQNYTYIYTYIHIYTHILIYYLRTYVAVSSAVNQSSPQFIPDLPQQKDTYTIAWVSCTPCHEASWMIPFMYSSYPSFIRV